MMIANYNINSVKGLLINVLYILFKAGWDPIFFDEWRSSDGTLYAVVDFHVSPDIIASSISDFISKLVLLERPNISTGKEFRMVLILLQHRG